jgi:hypothetical protein
MTANSIEAVTDRAIPLDKLSSRVEGQTGRAGYVVFVLNIGQVIDIFNIAVDVESLSQASLLPQVTSSKHSQQIDTEPVRASLPLINLKPNAVCVPAQNGSHH